MTEVNWTEIRNNLVATEAAWNAVAAPSMEKRRQVLQERARQLARRPDTVVTTMRLELLAFRLLSESYAVDTQFVREVIPLRNLAPVPCTPAFYVGVINVRGELCPVIDVRRLFNQADTGITNASRVVILRSDAMEIGVVVDSIIGARPVDAAALRPLPGLASTIDAEYLRGMVLENVMVINAGKLLAHPSLIVNDQVEG